MSVKYLVELQNIDTQLEDLNSLLGNLPKMVEELNQKENDLLSKIEENKIRLKNINLSSNKSETSNSQIDEKINKLTDQLFLVTNNKQYDALTNEIEHLQDQKSNHETDLLTYIEEKDILEKQIVDDEKLCEELKEDLNNRRGKLEKAMSETAEEKEALEKSRSEKVSEIDENIIQIYTKVISARSGVAVVSLSGDSCGGCGAALPPQKASEVRSGEPHRCDSCGRFLYSNKN
tara:strand:- start:197 stop:895 length:699 start_codon:yes stop_codon:yes gene_type:complete